MRATEDVASQIRNMVPEAIEILRTSGGPSSDDFSTASAFAGVLATKGDVLLFGSQRDAEWKSLLVRTVHAIAVLAFVPGGIRLFGVHWSAAAE